MLPGWWFVPGFDVLSEMRVGCGCGCGLDLLGCAAGRVAPCRAGPRFLRPNRAHNPAVHFLAHNQTGPAYSPLNTCSSLRQLSPLQHPLHPLQLSSQPPPSCLADYEFQPFRAQGCPPFGLLLARLVNLFRSQDFVPVFPVSHRDSILAHAGAENDVAPADAQPSPQLANPQRRAPLDASLPASPGPAPARLGRDRVDLLDPSHASQPGPIHVVLLGRAHRAPPAPRRARHLAPAAQPRRPDRSRGLVQGLEPNDQGDQGRQQGYYQRRTRR